MTHTITLDEAIERVRPIVEANPDHVYKSPVSGTCVYFDRDGTPSCLVGRAFAEELRAAGVDFEMDDNIRTLIMNGLLKADEGARRFLSGLQAEQDSGTPWGNALAEALKMVGRA